MRSARDNVVIVKVSSSYKKKAQKLIYTSIIEGCLKVQGYIDAYNT